MVGDWWTKPGKTATQRYQNKDGVESYASFPRGEFFAVAETR